MAQLSTRYYVYWDHENCPTPRNSAIHNVIDIIKEKVMNTLGIQSLNFHSIKFYNNNGKTPLCKQITNDLDRLAYIDCPTVNNRKNESVDKKIIADIGYDLWECTATHSMVIILISGDSDYSWLLSRIKTNISMVTTILIPKFRSTKKIVSTLKDCCDYVIDDKSLYVDKNFNKYALTLCSNGPNPSSTHLTTCRFYHKTKPKTPRPTYKQLLESKKAIDFLTKQAKIDLRHDPSLAENDCHAIIEHFSQCEPSETLSVIYLVDSIVGKVGGVFTTLFARHILQMMRVTYTAIGAMDEQDKLRQLLQEWDRKKTFSPNLLHQIEKAFSDIDAINQVSDHSDDESASSSDSDSDSDSSRIKCPNYQICKKSYIQKGKCYKNHVKKCVKKS